MTSDQVIVDASGRHSSGRCFRTLADEYADYAAGLRGAWGDEAPFPYEEFAIPYRQLRRSLLDACDQLGDRLRHAGDGQVVMAETNISVEHVNTVGITQAGQVEA